MPDPRRPPAKPQATLLARGSLLPRRRLSINRDKHRGHLRPPSPTVVRTRVPSSCPVTSVETAYTVAIAHLRVRHATRVANVNKDHSTTTRTTITA
jgi:hypothetical protein